MKLITRVVERVIDGEDQNVYEYDLLEVSFIEINAIISGFQANQLVFNGMAQKSLKDFVAEIKNGDEQNRKLMGISDEEYSRLLVDTAYHDELYNKHINNYKKVAEMAKGYVERFAAAFNKIRAQGIKELSDDDLKDLLFDDDSDNESTHQDE